MKTADNKVPKEQSEVKSGRPFWKFDLYKFSKIWYTSNEEKDQKRLGAIGYNIEDDEYFKQIRVLFCILQNINSVNNDLAITIAEVAEEANVSQDTVLRILRRMRERNFLQKKHNGLYIANPYILMQGDDKKLSRLYRNYCDAKRKPQEKDENQAEDDSQAGNTETSDQPASADSTSTQLKEDTVAEKQMTNRRATPPTGEFSKRSFWKFDIPAFANIWSNSLFDTSPKNEQFRQIKVLFYILQSISPSDNLLKLTYREIAANTNVSTSVVTPIMRRLQARNFLHKARNGRYIADPYMMMKGRDEERLSPLYKKFMDAKNTKKNPPKKNPPKKNPPKHKKREVTIDYSSPDAELFIWSEADELNKEAYDNRFIEPEPDDLPPTPEEAAEYME